MLRKLLLCFIVLKSLSCLGQENQLLNLFKSPDGNIGLEVMSSDANLILQLNYKDQKVRTILENYRVGVQLVEYKVVDGEWSTVAGERAQIKDHYEEITLLTKDEEQRNLKIICRLYNEGMAIRCEFDKEEFKGVTLMKDPMHMVFDGDFKTWTTERSQGEYVETTLSRVVKKVERPLLVQAGQEVFYAIGEAAVVNYPRSKFRQSSVAENALTFIPDSDVDLSKHYTLSIMLIHIT